MKKVELRNGRLYRKEGGVPLLCPLHPNSTDHTCSDNCAWFNIVNYSKVRADIHCRDDVIGFLK